MNFFTVLSMRSVLVMFTLAVLLVLAMSGSAHAQLFLRDDPGLSPEGPPGGFGIDGDMYANRPSTIPFNGASDWFDSLAGPGRGLLNNNGTPRNPKDFSIFGGDTANIDLIANRFDAVNSNGDTSWAGGSKVNDPSTQGIVLHNNNNKSEINHAYVAVTKDKDTKEFWINVGVDRQSNNGTDFIAMYLLQNGQQFSLGSNPSVVNTGPDAGFTIGDLLFSIAWSNGGTKPNIAVYAWKSIGAGKFDFVPDSTFDTTAIFISANTGGPLVLPTGYTVYGGQTSYQTNTFAEFSANINKVLRAAGVTCGVFTQANIFTVTSQNPSAQMKDLVTPIGVDIEISPLVNVAINPACEGSAGSMCAIITGGTPFGGGHPYHYSWSGPGGFSSSDSCVAVSASGSYILVVTDSGGCVVRDTAVYASFPKPILSCSGGDSLTCVKLTATTSVNTTPATGVSYQWTGAGLVSGGNSATATWNQPGIKKVVVIIDATGCTDSCTASVGQNITPPVLQCTGGDSITCTKLTATTSVSSTPSTGVSYQWSGAGLVSGGNSATATWNQPGTKKVIVTNNANGCTDSCTASVGLSVTPPVLQCTGGDSLTCTKLTANTSVSSTPSTGVSYQWSGAGLVSGGTSSTATWNQPGTKKVIVTITATGCKDSCTAMITQNITPPSLQCSGSDTITCTNLTGTTSVSSTPSTGVTYQWSGAGLVSGGTTPTATWNQPGTKKVVVTITATGCKDSCTATVGQNNTPPNLTARGGTVTCFAPTVQLSASSTARCAKYHWTGPNGFATYEQNPTAVDSGNYTITVTDTCNGCTKDTTVHVSNVIPQLNDSCGAHGPITTGFELDGDATSTGANPPDDWDRIRSGDAHPTSTTGIVNDAPSKTDDYFKMGTKDLTDVNQWFWSVNTTPDKDDILHGGAAQYGTQLYFFGDRYSTSGDAQIGFWFFKNPVDTLPNGTFTGLHTSGDLLVLSNFIQGGGTPVIFAYEWVGSGGSDGTLNKLSLTNANSFATVNSSSKPSPWPYQSKGKGTNNQFPAGAFFEGGIDLACLPGINVCFSSFLLETRTSQSVTASLKDFLIGRFSVGSAQAIAQAGTIKKELTPEEGVRLSSEAKPAAFALHANYPNPFNPTTVIRYDLPEASTVKLSIFNVLGQEVATLVNANLEAGYHSTEWNTENAGGMSLPSGVYFYRIHASSIATGQEFSQINKMVLIK